MLISFLSVFPPGVSSIQRPVSPQQDQLDRLAKVMPDQEKMAQLKLAQLGFQPSNWQEKMAQWNDTTEVGGQNFFLTNLDLIKFFLVVIPSLNPVFIEWSQKHTPSVHIFK